MAAPSKTLLDFFQQPAAKRLKRVSSPTIRSLSSPKKIEASLSTTTISIEQNLRMEYNKALAKSKRNRKLCADKLSKAMAAVGGCLQTPPRSEKHYWSVCEICHCASAFDFWRWKSQKKPRSQKHLRVYVLLDMDYKGVGFMKLEELLVEDTWLDVLSEEFQKPYANKLCEFLEGELCHGGIPIYPPQHLTFNALNTTPFDRVKAVIIGQDPYHGPGQAMGLSFSVPEGVKVPSSLVNIFKELREDVGCSIPTHGNLEKWAIQGILLLNAVLSVRQHQANSHANKGWEQFTDAVIRSISQKREGIVFLLWGNYAKAKSRLIDESKHHILKSAHPSGLSASRGFFGCRHFSRTNQILEKMGLSPVDWQL